MKFESKNIEISNEEFGCTITFSDRKEEHPERITTAQAAMDSMGQYVLLQRTYGEDEIDDDYYYIELSEFDDSGEFSNFLINLTPNNFEMKYGEELIQIGLNVSDNLYIEIQEALYIITNERGTLNIEK